MKICPGCGANLPDMAVFCNRCGRDINLDTDREIFKTPVKKSWMSAPSDDDLLSGDTTHVPSIKKGYSYKSDYTYGFKIPSDSGHKKPEAYEFKKPTDMGFGKVEDSGYKTSSSYPHYRVADDFYLFDTDSTSTYSDEASYRHSVDIPLYWEKPIDLDDSSYDYYLKPPTVKNRWVLLFSFIICIAFVIYSGAYIFNTGTGPGKVVDTVENAINGDAQEMIGIIDPYCLVDADEYRAEMISDIYVQKTRSLFDVNSDSYVNLELLSYSEVSNDKLNKLRNVYSKKNLYVEEAYNCRVKITIDSRGKTYDMNDLDCIVKINGCWYPCMIDNTNREWV